MRIQEEQLVRLQIVQAGLQAVILMERTTAQLMIAQNITEPRPLVEPSQQLNLEEIHKLVGKSPMLV